MSTDKQHFHLTLMMTSAQVVETSVTVTDNSPFQDYPHPDDHTTRSTVTPGFKPFTVLVKLADKSDIGYLVVPYEHDELANTSEDDKRIRKGESLQEEKTDASSAKKPRIDGTSSTVTVTPCKDDRQLIRSSCSLALSLLFPELVQTVTS